MKQYLYFSMDTDNIKLRTNDSKGSWILVKIPLNPIASCPLLLVQTPLAENHVHVGLFGEPMPQDLPLPFRMREFPIVSSNELRNHLGHFHHSNVFTNARSRTSAKLAIVSQHSQKGYDYNRIQVRKQLDILTAIMQRFISLS